MKTYELSYIISPDISSEDAQAKAKELELAVQSREGVILKQSNPIAKTFAFPIKGRASGFFGVLEFQTEPEKLLEIKEIIQKDGKIVRHMVIIKEAARIRKERGSRNKFVAPSITIESENKIITEPKAEIEAGKEEPEEKPAAPKEKVELKDIEQQLDEILGE